MHGSNKRVLNSNESAKTNESSAIKRLKKATTVQQSNTLLNYFGSNRKIDPKRDEPKQSSIMTYFKSESQLELKKEQKTENEMILIDSVDTSNQTVTSLKENEEKNLPKIQSKPDGKSEGKTNFLSLFNQTIKAEAKLADPIDTNQTPSNEYNKENRKCPFYKKIESKSKFFPCNLNEFKIIQKKKMFHKTPKS